MARVQVSDDTWSAFRVGLGATPVNVGLGQLVEREVAGSRRRSASDVDGVRAAVDDARLVAEELAGLISRFESGVGSIECAEASVRLSSQAVDV